MTATLHPCDCCGTGSIADTVCEACIESGCGWVGPGVCQLKAAQLEADVHELAERHGCTIEWDRENGPPGEVGVVAEHPEGSDIIGSGETDQEALEEALETLRSWGPP